MEFELRKWRHEDQRSGSSQIMQIYSKLRNTFPNPYTLACSVVCR